MESSDKISLDIEVKIDPDGVARPGRVHSVFLLVRLIYSAELQTCQDAIIQDYQASFYFYTPGRRRCLKLITWARILAIFLFGFHYVIGISDLALYMNYGFINFSWKQKYNTTFFQTTFALFCTRLCYLSTMGHERRQDQRKPASQLILQSVEPQQIWKRTRIRQIGLQLVLDSRHLAEMVRQTPVSASSVQRNCWY